MSTIDKDTMENFGLKDGRDKKRFEEAEKLSPVIDLNPVSCFIRLVELEKDGYISLSDDGYIA